MQVFHLSYFDLLFTFFSKTLCLKVSIIYAIIELTKDNWFAIKIQGDFLFSCKIVNLVR